MPIVLIIDADSAEEAQDVIDTWAEEIEMDSLPSGTEDVDYSPVCESDDEGRRVLYLPSEDFSSDEDSDEDDDFGSTEDNEL